MTHKRLATIILTMTIISPLSACDKKESSPHDNNGSTYQYKASLCPYKNSSNSAVSGGPMIHADNSLNHDIISLVLKKIQQDNPDLVIKNVSYGCYTTQVVAGVSYSFKLQVNDTIYNAGATWRADIKPEEYIINYHPQSD